MTKWKIGNVLLVCMQYLDDASFRNLKEKHVRKKRKGFMPSSVRDTAIIHRLNEQLGNPKIFALANPTNPTGMHPDFFYQGSISDPRRSSRGILRMTKLQALAVLCFHYVRMPSEYGLLIIEPFCSSIIGWKNQGVIDEETLITIYSSDANDSCLDKLRALKMEEVIINAKDIPLFNVMTPDMAKLYLNAPSNKKELKTHNKALTFNVFRLTPESLRIIDDISSKKSGSKPKAKNLR